MNLVPLLPNEVRLLDKLRELDRHIAETGEDVWYDFDNDNWQDDQIAYSLYERKLIEATHKSWDGGAALLYRSQPAGIAALEEYERLNPQVVLNRTKDLIAEGVSDKIEIEIIEEAHELVSEMMRTNDYGLMPSLEALLRAAIGDRE